MYGTTTQGGSNNLGTVYKLSLATNSLTTLVNFNGVNGEYPVAPVTLDGQGHLYGTTNLGNSNQGTVYKVNLATRYVTTLVRFNGANGSTPYAGVTLDGQGHLYGTTQDKGKAGGGTVYKLNLATRYLTTLVNFNGANGAIPFAGVTLDGQGHLYGTTSAGGAHSKGTVFKVNLATRYLTTLVSFDTSRLANPGGVTLDTSGSLFGTTRFGGANGSGTLYELTPNP